jgi:hypothetical protein
MNTTIADADPLPRGSRAHSFSKRALSNGAIIGVVIGAMIGIAVIIFSLNQLIGQWNSDILPY